MNDLFGPTVNTEPIDGEKGRTERGAFFTPDALALAICQELNKDPIRRNIATDGFMLEPGCGGGAFLRAAHKTWPHMCLDGIDLLPACKSPGHVVQGDVFKLVSGDYDLILGNPDFSVAGEMVRHCMGLLHQGGVLALLLRCGFEMSNERIPLFSDFPLLARAAIPQRPSFISSGATDRYDYALFVWQQGHQGTGHLLPPIIWR